MTYDRTARVASTAEGLVRLTLDSNLRATPVDAPAFVANAGESFLAGHNILELKYHARVPAVFRRLIEEFALKPQTASKYRLAAAGGPAARARGLAGARAPPATLRRMSEFLGAAILPVPPDGTAVLVRLVLAMLAGGVVTLIYRFTRAADETAPSFTVTLVLLAILIAMVTQVIGDNVARAFSLVGALSIVRFRTVVRDTQDTAYVIFAVAVGMAVGAGHPGLAASGLGVIAFAALRDAQGSRRRFRPPRSVSAERSRRARARSRDAAGDRSSTRYLVARHLVSIGTAKQGLAIELSYRAALRNEENAAELVNALNRVDGVQSVSLERMDCTDRLRR